MTPEPVSTAQAAAAVAAAAVTITAVPVGAAPVLGIPVDVLLASSAGALFGLAYTKPDTWAKFMSLPEGRLAVRAGCATLLAMGLLFTLACNALLAGWATEVLPHLPMMNWTAKVAPQPLAGILAFVGQFAIPRGIKAVEEWRAPWSRAK